MTTTPEARLFCITEDNGSREDLSILYEPVLVVTSGPDMGDGLTACLEGIIRLDPTTKVHEYDRNDPDDQPYVVQKLEEAGYEAYFQDIESYIN